MKITTKYNVNDSLYVTLVDQDYVILKSTSGKVLGATIKLLVVDSITADGKTIVYNFPSISRQEEFVFDNLKDAKKHAQNMVGVLAKQNRELIENLSFEK